MRIGKYIVTKEDDLNFGLYYEREKGKFRGKEREGLTEVFVGYYGYLDDVMMKIINLEARNNIDDVSGTREILELIRTVETNLNDAYRIRAKEMCKWKKYLCL